MPLIGIGTDIVQIRRIQALVKRYGEKYLNRIFTPAERDEAQKLSPAQRGAFYARRFAVKEAVSKALGTGIGALAGWREIETIHDEKRAPAVRLSGKAAATLRQKAGGRPAAIHLSVSDDSLAVAFVVIEIRE